MEYFCFFLGDPLILSDTCKKLHVGRFHKDLLKLNLFGNILLPCAIFVLFANLRIFKPALLFFNKVLFINFLSVQSLSIFVVEKRLLDNLNKICKIIVESRPLLLLNVFMEAELNHSYGDEVIICQLSLEFVNLIVSIDFAKVASL
jgi:hypothetical protein